jgi:hypothetical protein
MKLGSQIAQAADKFVNDAVAFTRSNAIPGLVIVLRRKRDNDEMPSGGIRVNGAIVVGPAGDGRQRGVLAQDLAHFRRRLRSQAPLSDLRDDRMPFRPNTCACVSSAHWMSQAMTSFRMDIPG